MREPVTGSENGKNAMVNPTWSKSEWKTGRKEKALADKPAIPNHVGDCAANDRAPD